MTLELSGVASGALQGATLSIPGGLTVVLGTPADGTAELVPVLGGLLVPKRGNVSVGGADPSRSPATRARLGVVLQEEPQLFGRSVAQAVAAVLALRGEPGAPTELLASHGLSSLAAIAPEKLDPSTRRHLAFVLALAIRSPVGLVIHEPLALGPHASREATLRALWERAETGVPVVVTTASPRDASELGGSVVVLDRGRFVRRPGTPLATELVPGANTTLLVRTPEARALGQALLSDPAVTSLEWLDSGELRVRGPDAERLSLALLARAREVSASLHAIETALPALEEVRAATAAIWRAAYDSAFRTVSRQREEAAAPPPATAPAPQPTPSAGGTPE